MSKIIFKGKTPDGVPYLIRYPKKTDLQELWRYINELSKERTHVLIQGEIISFEEERKFLNNLLKKIKNMENVFLLVESQGKVVGVSDIEMRIRAEKHTAVFGITLAKEFRSKGIGKILMQKVIDESKKKLEGLKIIRLACFADNFVALKLYKTLGFKQYGLLPGGLLYRGKPMHEILMYKEIN